jgi:hypothetical protein
LKQDNVIGLKSPGVPSAVSDALTELLRDGARQMLALAVEAEVQEFLLRHRSHQDEGRRQRLVRNGYLPERTLQTGLGAIGVRAPGLETGAKRSNSARRYCRHICDAGTNGRGDFSAGSLANAVACACLCDRHAPPWQDSIPCLQQNAHRFPSPGPSRRPHHRYRHQTATRPGSGR